MRVRARSQDGGGTFVREPLRDVGGGHAHDAGPGRVRGRRGGRGCQLGVLVLPQTSFRKFALAPSPEADGPFTMSVVTRNLRDAVKMMTTVPGFDRVWEKVILISAAPEKVICEMKVEVEHTNKLGTLHGGLTATLVDCISTMALLCSERGAPGVSVDMNITYMSPAKIGEEIVITANILKQGRTLAFTSVDLTNKATGKLIAQGRHTKHLGN
ncbi:acyl-coenzyme A thioesterase 13 [Ctenodactylus gundi]